MKLLTLIVCAALVSASQAGILDELKGHLTGVTDLVKEVGNHLATASAGHVKQLLEQAKLAGNSLLQSTLLNLLQTLQTSTPGKRELGMLERIEESRQWLNNHFENAKGEVDGVMNASLEKLKAAAEKVLNLKFLENENPEEIIQEIETAVAHQSSVLSGFVEGVFRQLLEQFRPTPARRFIKDSLQWLVDFFTPHVTAVTQVFKDFASTLQGHATNVVDVLKSKTTELKTAMNLVAAELKGKLANHVDQLKLHGDKLKGYGTDAYQALLAAVTDILAQTSTNVVATGKEAISQTVAGVAQTITDQLIQLIAQGGN